MIRCGFVHNCAIENSIIFSDRTIIKKLWAKQINYPSIFDMGIDCRNEWRCRRIIKKWVSPIGLTHSWGSRIWTYEWRSQSPLPYRLAIPQYKNFKKGGWSESNRRPPEPQSGALTNWATSTISGINAINPNKKGKARLKGLEPLAHCLEGSCSIHLSYKRR